MAKLIHYIYANKVNLVANTWCKESLGMHTHTHAHVALKVFDFSTSLWVDESSFMVWGFLTSNVPAIVLLLLE